jgi:hypothetical protein
VANNLVGVAIAGAVVLMFQNPGRAEEIRAPRIVFHLSVSAKVSAKELATARSEVGRVYDRIGVAVEWAEGFAPVPAPPDEALHLDVVLISKVMGEPGDELPTTFGRASRYARRAYIHYWRISEHALLTRVEPARLLATVIAHEVGHMLLPDYSHSSRGLMQARWPGRVVEVPRFLPWQGEAIRSFLIDSAANGHPRLTEMAGSR